MDWATIIAAIIEAIMECRQRQSRAQVEARMKRIGPLEWLVIRRTLAKEGIRGRDARRATDNLQEQYSACQSDGAWSDCCDDLLNQAEDLAASDGVELAG